MLILIFYFTFLSFLVIISSGWRLGRKGSFFFSLTSNLLSLTIIFISYFNFLSDSSNVVHYKLGNWFQSDSFSVNWGFLFDPLSLTMCVVVLTISSLVQIYSFSYMFEDPSLPRFLSYLCLFVFFMLVLVTADNFVLLFMGWEGVGLCSYLLISFWNTRVPALKASLKAMLVNRIGDFFLLTGMLLIFNEFNSLNFLELFPLVLYFENSSFFLFDLELNLLTTICIFLSLGAFGKSAQLGLHVWLPDAMEGPTPVSALIHAATMVTAGVFLVIRCSPIFEFSSSALCFLAIVGACTSVFAGLCGLTEVDIKKIIAYSTCSQLGYMFFVCGLSGYNIGLFHLFNHAFFKALLFLSAGSVIHAISNEQNIMRMGGLANILPFTFASTFIGLLSLTAFPFTAGFFSKESILSVAYVSFGSIGTFCYLLGVFTSFLTSFYSYRLFYYTFISEVNINKKVVLNIHSENSLIVFVLFILSFLSIFSGFLFKDIFLGVGSNFFDYSIFISPENLKMYNAEFLPFYLKILPLVASCLGWGILNPYIFDTFIKFKLPSCYNLFKNEWFFNRYYNTKLSSIYLKGFYFFFLTIDSGLLQLFGPKGLSSTMDVLAFNVSKLHGGFLHKYLCFFFFNLLFLFFTVKLFGSSFTGNTDELMSLLFK